jgi:protein-serine/threonine kinase
MEKMNPWRFLAAFSSKRVSGKTSSRSRGYLVAAPLVSSVGRHSEPCSLYFPRHRYTPTRPFQTFYLFAMMWPLLTLLVNGRADDDGNYHIDSDTPRSGIATPQPDPSDKRLPGIMHSFFGQVGLGSSTHPSPEPPEPPVLSTKTEEPFHHRETMAGDYVLLSVAPDSENKGATEHFDRKARGTLPLHSHERKEPPQAPERSRMSGLHSYPTPPASQTPSMHNFPLCDASSEGDSASARKGVHASFSPLHRKSISESIPFGARRPSLMNPLSNIVTASNVHAVHFSSPFDLNPATTSSTPVHSRINSEFHDSPSIERLKKLTNDAPRDKSIPPTPTRALSHTTVKSDASNGSDPAIGSNGKLQTGESSTAQTSVGLSGASVTAPKGKLTIKINEARGLRKSRDPYVVAVFQRNELVSSGPRDDVEEDHEESTISIPMGGIPIMRSGSDSGRPMAIPMKSRQSSNTSLSDYRDFKVKGRRSFTNPKWDTEAVL